MRVLFVAVVVASAPVTGALGMEADGVELGGVFGRATAGARDLTSATIELDLEVEADPEAVVVAHLIEPGGGQETLPLATRGNGLFGLRTEVRRIDYVVVFESLEGPIATQSTPLRLTELGVEPAILGVLPVSPTVPEEISESTRQWGWLGLGLAAAALTLLAFWAMPDRRRRQEQELEPPPVEAEPDPEDDPAL
ncbi:MAG: hypothetical protein ACRDWH_10185 [Acidimicrobiia bacterium]